MRRGAAWCGVAWRRAEGVIEVVSLIWLTLLHVGKAEVGIHVATPVLVDSRELAVAGREVVGRLG